MLKGNYLLLSLAAALVCWQVAGTDTASSGIVDASKSTVRSGFLPSFVGRAASGGQARACTTVYVNQAGVVMCCPRGDGDELTSTVGGANCQITLTVFDVNCKEVAGIPPEDMWLIGCNGNLLLCGGSEGTQADHASGNGDILYDYPKGETTFSHSLKVGGCDLAGVYCVVQGTVVGPICLPIQARSIDYKSAGGAGNPAPCLGDISCPDGKVTNADFSWFVTHYPPGGTYAACADFAAPLGSPIGLADFAKFNVHFAGAGHKCL